MNVFEIMLMSLMGYASLSLIGGSKDLERSSVISGSRDSKKSYVIGQDRNGKSTSFLESMWDLKESNPLSSLAQRKQIDAINDRMDALEEECTKLGGTVINGECYEYLYLNQIIDFKDARKFCQNKGGDLWTPKMNDVFLREKLALKMPEVFRSEFGVWIGITHTDFTFSTDINGNDVTDTILGSIRYSCPFPILGDDSSCFVYDKYSTCTILCDISGTSPDFHLDVICEYPISVTPITSQKTTFFDKIFGEDTFIKFGR